MLSVHIGTLHLTVCTFQSESKLYSCLNVKKLLARNKLDIWNSSDCNGTVILNHLVDKQTLNHLAKLTKSLSCITRTYLFVVLDRMLLPCTCAFESEFKLYSCLNVKELRGQNKCDIWNLSDSNRTGTHNHLVCKRTPKNLAELAKWLSCVVSSYLYGPFDNMLLPCQLRISKWVHTL